MSLPDTLTTPDASAREAPRPSMPRPSMVQVLAASSKARLASPRNTATVGPNLTRIEPRHMPSPWSGDSVAPGMHDATSAGSRSNGQTLSAGEGMVVVSVTVGMARQYWPTLPIPWGGAAVSAAGGVRGNELGGLLSTPPPALTPRTSPSEWGGV